MQSQTLHWVDYTIIITILVASVGFGGYFANRQKSTNKYFKGGGTIPAWALGMSILATIISSVTFLAYPGAAYKSNWILLVQGLMVPVVLLSIVWFIVPLYRDVIGLSAYEYFEKRFGVVARLYSSVGFILAHFSKMGTVFFLLAVALSSMMGVNTYLILWVLGISIITLTLLGGIEAVIWLDVFQGFMFIVGGLLTLGILLFVPAGGPTAVLKIAYENNKMGFGPYDLDFTKLTFIVLVLNGIFYAIQKYGTDQTIIQRYLVAKSDKAAIKASLIGVLLCIPVWAMFMFIGTCLFSYYKITGASLPANIKADAVFPYFIVNEMPIGIIGLVISALIAAAVSTLDADMNCLAAIGVEDYYCRIKKNTTDKQKLTMGKIFVVFSGLGALGIATIYIESGGEGVLGIIFGLYAIFSAGIAGLFLLGIFSKRANKQGLYIGMATCVLFTAYALLTSMKVDFGNGPTLILDLGKFNFTHHDYMLGVYSHVILFGVGWAASFLFPKREIDKNLTIYSYIEKRKQGEVR